MLPLLDEEYIQTGQVYYIYKDFIIFGDPSVAAAMAAECAGELGDYWAMHDWLFQNQSTWKFKPNAQELITQAAIEELGFDAPAFTECLTSRRYEQEIEEDTDEAIEAGARGTPAFLINGRFFPGYMPWETFRNVVEAVLAETSG